MSVCRIWRHSRGPDRFHARKLAASNSGGRRFRGLQDGYLPFQRRQDCQRGPQSRGRDGHFERLVEGEPPMMTCLTLP